MKILYIYLIVINLVAFALMGLDKHRAHHHRWRISERTMLLTALFGGSLGAMLGMWLFWHKTRHKLFAIGLPVMFFLHLALSLALLT